MRIYRHQKPWKTICMVGGITLGYAICLWLLDAVHFKADAFVPPLVIKSVKFAAFLLASYSLWQSIGRAEYRQQMVDLMQQGNPREREYAREQIILAASDEDTGLKFGGVAFFALMLLALFGLI